MSFSQWKDSNENYARKLVHSGLEGARSGREAFFSGHPLAPFLHESAHHALTAAALGLGIGVLSGISSKRDRSARRALACGLVGGAVGFGAAVVWESRRLGSSMLSGAWKNIGEVRDEHWFEKNPIDYA